MSKKRLQNVNYKSKRYKNPIGAEQQKLKKKLVRNLSVLSILIILMIGGLFKFGNHIGTVIGWITGNTAEIVNRDTVPPPRPVFIDPPTTVKDQKIRLEGYTEAGSTVVLYANGPEVKRTTADIEGRFTFIDIELIEGTNSIFAKAYDGSNNESEPSNTLRIQVDKEEPKINITSPKDGEVIQNLDKRIIIKGEVSEKATLTINEKVAIVRPDLSFEFTLGVDDGEVKITIIAQDQAGNEAKETISVTYRRR